MNPKKMGALVIDALEDIKAKNIVMINVSRLTSMFDYIVIASGDSNRQTKALANNVREKLKEAGAHVYGSEGEETGEWVLVDLGDIVVHVMQPTVREYYRLEELWRDGKVEFPKPEKGEKDEKAEKGENPKAAKTTKTTKSASGDAKKSTARKPASKKPATGKPAGGKAAAMSGTKAKTGSKTGTKAKTATSRTTTSKATTSRTTTGKTASSKASTTRKSTTGAAKAKPAAKPRTARTPKA
jgi:ribosome-associated protein